MVDRAGVRGGAAAVVVGRIRRQIVEGALREGAMLPPERELAAQLGVSRPTLRQALSILAQMGLVTTLRGRSGGIVVTTPSVATVEATVTLLFQTNVITAAQLTEVCRGLEVEAAQLAAARRSEADVSQLWELLALYVGSEEDIDLHDRRGRELHYAIARASGNPLLVQMMYSLNEAFEQSLELVGTLTELRSIDDALHRPIVEAIARQDVEAARRSMTYHFDHLQQVQADYHIAERPLGRQTPPADRGSVPVRARRQQGD